MELQKDGVIVVPIDFSEANVAAINAALQLARDSALVHLVHVTYPPVYTAYGFAYTPPIEDAALSKAINDHFGEFAEKHGVGHLTRTVRTGDVGAEIVDYAREFNARLIVIPSHGYHGAKRLFLGSVAHRVLQLAECPVLFLRRSDTE